MSLRYQETFIFRITDFRAQQRLRIERIRQEIEKIEIPNDKGNIVKLTTSIGYACWKPGMLKDETVDDVHRRLMSTADRAVYKAKQSGRNRVRGEQYCQLRDS